MAKKRANGEGSIRKRKDGRWEGRYTAGHDPATGKTIYKNVLGKTQAEVKCDFRISKSDSLNDFSNICTETQSHRRREVCHPLLQKAFDHFFDVRFGGNAPGIIFV